MLARIPIFRSLGRKQGWISDHVADRRVPQSTRRQAVACGPSPLSFVYKMLNYRGEGRWFVDEWEIFVTDEVREWIGSLDDVSRRLVVQVHPQLRPAFAPVFELLPFDGAFHSRCRRGGRRRRACRSVRRSGRRWWGRRLLG